MSNSPKTVSLAWDGDENGQLILLDQTQLPLDLIACVCTDVDLVFEAIQSLRVRGAPAIGVAAAYGVVLGMQSAKDDPASLADMLSRVCDYLAGSRPTAVNLFWALDRMKLAAQDAMNSKPALLMKLLAEAKAIHQEDRQMCRAIGKHGASLLADGNTVLTHCNAGGLATSEYGTALALIYAAREEGKNISAFVDETRPLLQGARLTAWELMESGVPTTLICDSMAASVMRAGKVQAVIVGADRIAANGDVANKIGTYSVALAAKAHNVPFYVAAPSSTFDLSLASGDGIPIEERRGDEITQGFGIRTAPPGVKVYNPAFDVTPAELVTAIVCERGIITPVNRETIANMLSSSR